MERHPKPRTSIEQGTIRKTKESKGSITIPLPLSSGERSRKSSTPSMTHGKRTGKSRCTRRQNPVVTSNGTLWKVVKGRCERKHAIENEYTINSYGYLVRLATLSFTVSFPHQHFLEKVSFLGCPSAFCPAVTDVACTQRRCCGSPLTWLSQRCPGIIFSQCGGGWRSDDYPLGRRESSAPG